MTFNQKLFLVFAIIYFTVWIVKRYPDSSISRILLTWNGPFPLNGETYSAFKLRWATYALKWFVILTGILIPSAWLNNGISDSDPLFIIAMIAFVLPLASCMALFGGAGLAVHALYLRYIGKPRVFNEETGEFEIKK